MKTSLSSDYLTHQAQPLRTEALCLRLERLDGVVLTVTCFNRQLTIDVGFGNEVYEPFGFNVSDVEQNGDMDTGTTEAGSYLDSAIITEDDVRIGRWDFAAYELFFVNWADLTMGRDLLSTGTLGVVRSGRIAVTGELLSLMRAVQNSVGILSSPLCIHNFAKSEAAPGRGNGCTVDPAPHTVTGTVFSVDSDLYTINDGSRTEPDGYFSNGEFVITTGTYAGMRFEVRAYVEGLWVLFTAVPDDISGEDYELIRGCNKTRRQCIDVFGNILDRLAFDWTQGRDAALSVGRHN